MLPLQHTGLDRVVVAVKPEQLKKVVLCLNEIQARAAHLIELVPSEDLYTGSLICDLIMDDLSARGMLEVDGAGNFVGWDKEKVDSFVAGKKSELLDKASEAYKGSEYAKVVTLVNKLSIVENLFAVCTMANWEISSTLLQDVFCMGEERCGTLRRLPAILEMLKTYFDSLREGKKELEATVDLSKVTDTSVLTKFDDANDKLSEAATHLFELYKSGEPNDGVTH